MFWTFMSEQLLSMQWRLGNATVSFHGFGASEIPSMNMAHGCMNVTIDKCSWTWFANPQFQLIAFIGFVLRLSLSDGWKSKLVFIMRRCGCQHIFIWKRSSGKQGWCSPLNIYSMVTVHMPHNRCTLGKSFLGVRRRRWFQLHPLHESILRRQPCI